MQFYLRKEIEILISYLLQLETTFSFIHFLKDELSSLSCINLSQINYNAFIKVYMFS